MSSLLTPNPQVNILPQWPTQLGQQGRATALPLTVKRGNKQMTGHSKWLNTHLRLDESLGTSADESSKAPFCMLLFIRCGCE